MVVRTITKKTSVFLAYGLTGVKLNPWVKSKRTNDKGKKVDATGPSDDELRI